MGPILASASSRASVIFAIFLTLSVFITHSVKRGDFKTCEQAGFCKRNRDRASRAASPEFAPGWETPYKVHDLPVWSEERNTLHATLRNELHTDITFGLNITFLHEGQGTLRIKIDQMNGLRQRFNEADKWTLWKQPSLLTSKDLQLVIGNNQTTVRWPGIRDHTYQFELQYSPLLVTLLKDDQPHVVLNERGLFNMEHFRNKPRNPDQPATGDLLVQGSDDNVITDIQNHSYPGFPDLTQDGMWEETFGGRTDSKPKGPESLSLDITFPGYSHVYGIPEHASPLSLKPTRGSSTDQTSAAYTDPYRLWNLDVFEYEHDSEMALYGAIPFMKAHRSGSTVGVFWLNAAETWIDVEKQATEARVIDRWLTSDHKSSQDALAQDHGPEKLTSTTHWMSESGILDLFIFLGPSSKEIFSSFGGLVGTTAMPPYFSIAYHQCRWNYVSQEDLLGVVRNFDKYDIPLDVMWLDIEYAEEHKYFIWDKKNFPEPLKMIGELEATGRKVCLSFRSIIHPALQSTTL